MCTVFPIYAALHVCWQKKTSDKLSIFELLKYMYSGSTCKEYLNPIVMILHWCQCKWQTHFVLLQLRNTIYITYFILPKYTVVIMIWLHVCIDYHSIRLAYVHVHACWCGYLLKAYVERIKVICHIPHIPSHYTVWYNNWD